MYKKNKLLKSLLIVFITFSAMIGDVLSAKTNYQIAVLYPDVRKPFSSFFENITAGIQQSNQSNITVRPVSKSESTTTMSDWLQNANPDAIILLGTDFKKFKNELNGPYKLIYGASFFSKSHIEQGKSGISITPDPQILFNKLKQLTPNVNEVDVVYHESTNGWLVDKAQLIANKLKIKLNRLAVANTKEAALTYKTIISTEKSPNKALWLLQHDPTLDEKSLLPKILADAWEHEKIVFSSNPRHVKRGALFSTLPDNKKLGEDLAKKAIDVLHGKNATLEPMQSSLMIANIRTARHLSLPDENFSEDDFEVIYPREK